MPFRFSTFFFFGPPFSLLSVPRKLRVCTPEFEQLKPLKHDAWKTIRLPSEPFAVETSTGSMKSFPKFLAHFEPTFLLETNPGYTDEFMCQTWGKDRPPEGDGVWGMGWDQSFLPWMSCWKLGSMVRISGWSNPKEYTPFIGRLYITQLILTIDPNFQPDIQVGNIGKLCHQSASSSRDLLRDSNGGHLTHPWKGHLKKTPLKGSRTEEPGWTCFFCVFVDNMMVYSGGWIFWCDLDVAIFFCTPRG